MRIIGIRPACVVVIKLPHIISHSSCNQDIVRVYIGRVCLFSHWFPHLRTARRTMKTSSNGNIFRVTGPLCGEFTGPGEFPAQRPVTRSFDVFFDLRLNKRLSKQSWGWWFETPPWSLWRQCNADHGQIDMASFMTVKCRENFSPHHWPCLPQWG